MAITAELCHLVLTTINGGHSAKSSSVRKCKCIKTLLLLTSNLLGDREFNDVSICESNVFRSSNVLSVSSRTG